MKKSFIQNIFLVFLFVVFSIGAYVYSSIDMKQTLDKLKGTQQKVSCVEGLVGCQCEGFENSPQDISGNVVQTSPKENQNACYDLLIQQGNKIHMYDTSSGGSNKDSVTFDTLADYTKYLDTQRKNGNRCPVLFLQQETDTQGNPVYKNKPNPFDTTNHLPITSSVVRNINLQPIQTNKSDYYSAFDPMGLYVGKVTDLDVLHESTTRKPISENPMDPNWGGVLYTQYKVDQGLYDGNRVTRVSYPNAGPNQPPNNPFTA